MIRSYNSADFQSVAKLYKNSATYGGQYDAERDEPERLLKTAENGNLLVCEIENSIVGTVMILDNPHSFWLIRFAVDPSYARSHEVANELDKAVSVIAKQRGHSNILVYTDPQDSALKQRYEQLGFNESSDYRCFWKGVK